MSVVTWCHGVARLLIAKQNGKGLFLAGDGVEALFHKDDIEGIVQHARTEMSRLKDDAAAPSTSLLVRSKAHFGIRR